MRKLKFYSLLFLICFSCQPKQPDIIGVWQDLPIAASGWSNTYQFFSDGSYIFNYSTMDCAKRTIRHSGEYKFESDNTILLITKNKTIVEGGKLVPAMGSCGSEFELEDGIVKEIQLANHENNKLSISSISLDQEAKEKMTINGTGFWRFSKDPLFYNSHSY